METLVYIGLLFVVLGLGYAVVYRCIEQSILLRRSTEDMARVLDAGERWRADVRAASAGISSEGAQSNQLVYLKNTRGEVTYRFAGGAVARRVSEGPWIPVVSNVKASAMVPDSRREVSAWRWEVELQPRKRASAQPGRVRPLFTFIAVPQPGTNP
jgi:hypothetical protein